MSPPPIDFAPADRELAESMMDDIFLELAHHDIRDERINELIAILDAWMRHLPLQVVPADPPAPPLPPPRHRIRGFFLMLLVSALIWVGIVAAVKYGGFS